MVVFPAPERPAEGGAGGRGRREGQEVGEGGRKEGGAEREGWKEGVERERQ